MPLTGSTVEQNLKNYLGTEDEVDSYCENCCPEQEQRHLPADEKIKTKHQRKSDITNPAEIVAITIKRFTNDGRKMFKRVEENLMMTLVNIDYELKGTITHSGTRISVDHYLANLYFSKGQVVNCNDMEISEGSKMTGLSYKLLFEKSNGRSNLSQISSQFSCSALNAQQQTRRVPSKRKAKEVPKEKTSKEYNDKCKRSKKSGSNAKRS